MGETTTILEVMEGRVWSCDRWAVKRAKYLAELTDRRNRQGTNIFQYGVHVGGHAVLELGQLKADVLNKLGDIMMCHQVSMSQHLQ